MSDVKKAYEQIVEFLSNKSEKTLLLRGIANKEKQLTLLKALNDQGEWTGLINLIHTKKSGMEEFFRWAGLYEIKVPKNYGQGMKLLDLTIFFDNLTMNKDIEKYDKYTFDFMIIWPIVSVTKNEKEIQMLKEMAERQRTKKIIYLTIKEPLYNPDSMEKIVDRVIRLDCENDNPEEYHRIFNEYQKELNYQEER